MKKALIAALIVLVMMSVSLASATTFKQVTIKSTTADIAYTHDYGGITQGNKLTIIKYFPFNLSAINTSDNNISITASSTTASTTVDVYVNGVLVANATKITGGSTDTITFPDFAKAGVKMDTNKLNITIIAKLNNTSADVLHIYGTNVPVTTNFSYTVSEIILSKPEVKYYEESSYYAVKQEITITQNSSFNLTNVICQFEYPSNAISKDGTSYNYGSLNVSQKKTHALSFEKRGPFVVESKIHKKNNLYITSFDIYSPETLKADFTLNPTVFPWSNFFPAFSKQRIENITLNGEKVSYTDPPSTISMELSLKEGHNTLNITYKKPEMQTAAIAVMQYTPKPFYEQPWFEVLAIIIIASLAIIIIYKDRER